MHISPQAIKIQYSLLLEMKESHLHAFLTNACSVNIYLQTRIIDIKVSNEPVTKIRNIIHECIETDLIKVLESVENKWNNLKFIKDSFLK